MKEDKLAFERRQNLRNMDPERPGSRAILAGQICASHGRAIREGLGTEALDANSAIAEFAVFTGNDLYLVFCSADPVLKKCITGCLVSG